MSRGTSFRRVSAALGAVGLFALTLSAQQQPPAGQRRVDVLITFDRTPGPAERALVNGLGGQVRFSYTIVPGMAASLPDTAVAALGNNPRVLAIEPDGQVFGHDAELDAVWGVTRIGSGDAHSTGVTGQGVVVGVMDSGIAYDHPDLNANYLPSASWDFVNSDADPFDDNKHGSHVSGTVAAADDNSGVVGVAPSAEIAALKVLNAQGSGAWSGVIAALDKAVRDGVIDVTNSSFGSSSNPGTLVESAYDAAWAAGIVNVASAGNSGNCGGKGNSVGYPARFASVIAVGATTSSDGRPCFSSTGPDVELAAPGVSIYSTVPGGGYAYFNGTSMASPHVAGAAALLISAGVTDSNGDNHVNDEVRNILTSTAIDLGSSGRDTQFGFGLVDVVAALAALGPGAPVTDAVNVSLSTDKATYVQDTDATVTLTALVSDENGQPITGLVITDFAVLLDNAQVALVTNWGPTANAGQYTATISLPAAGMHTVQVTVNDSSAVGTGSASFNVQAAGDGTATVQSVTWGGSGGKNNDKHLLVTIAIVDGSSQPIANATVAVDVFRDGGPYTSGVGTTGSNGQVTFQLTNPPSGCYSAVVTSVTVGGSMSTPGEQGTPTNITSPCKQ
jgi:subtilisin